MKKESLTLFKDILIIMQNVRGQKLSCFILATNNIKYSVKSIQDLANFAIWGNTCVVYQSLSLPEALRTVDTAVQANLEFLRVK